MTARAVVSVLLALQHAATVEQADALLNQISDPFTQRLARKQWREAQAKTVVTVVAS